MPSVENMELVSLLQAIILKLGINICSSITSCKSKHKGSEFCLSAAITAPSVQVLPPEPPIPEEFGLAIDISSCFHGPGSSMCSSGVRRWRLKYQQAPLTHPWLRKDRKWLETTGVRSLLFFFFSLKNKNTNSPEDQISCQTIHWSYVIHWWWYQRLDE